MSNAFLIVGLGNPGLKYKKTRHNIGFRVLDEFQKENNFPKFKLDKKSKAEISKGIINDREVLLAKPQTFMNNSGISVKSLTTNYQLLTTNLFVVHDDFDLQFGEVKTSQASGAAGHHGVESIIQALGTNNFKRIRIGTRPNNYQLPPKESKLPTGQATTNYQLIKAKDFVLKKFSNEEEKILKTVIKKAGQTLLAIIVGI